jgi:hypothetical protein
MKSLQKDIHYNTPGLKSIMIPEDDPGFWPREDKAVSDRKERLDVETHRYSRGSSCLYEEPGSK